MDQEAIEEILRVARTKHFMVGGADFGLVPSDMRVEQLSENWPVAPFPVAKNVFDDSESFSEYVNRHKGPGTTILACVDSGDITACIDYFPEGSKSANKAHWAQFKLRASEAFKAWSQFEGTLHKQGAFLQFLDENAETDIIDPSPAAMLDLVRDFQAVKSEDFKSSQRLDNGDRAFKFKSETNVTSAVEVPKEILLHIPIYEGEAAVNIRCKFRYRLDEGVLRLGFEFHRITELRNEAFRQTMIGVSSATDTSVLAGRFGSSTVTP